MEDELPRTRRVEPRLLDPLGVADLLAYIDELRIEIARAEAAIGSKQRQQSVAESFFRK